MLVRNRLNAGDYIIPIPLGLPLSLVYNAEGILQSCKLWKPNESNEGFDFKYFKLPDTITECLRKNNSFPNIIPIKGNTTVVSGVMLFEEYCEATGMLPGAIMDFYLGLITTDVNCKFYAMHVLSYAATFRGSVPTRKWLSLAHFSMLTGFLAPFNRPHDVDELLVKYCKGYIVDGTHYTNNLFMAYAIYNGTNFYVYSTCLSQTTVVSDVYRKLNENGVIYGHIKCSDDIAHVETWDKIVACNIWKNATIVYYGDELFMSVAPGSKVFKQKRSYDTACSVCGKKIKITLGGVNRCEDVNCMSRSYPDVKHMLATFHMPEISFEDYLKAVKDEHLSVLADVLDMKQYDDLKLEVSLTTLFQAVISERWIPVGRNVIDNFISQCKNEVKTAMYYVENPVKITSDLSIPSNDGYALQTYFNDPVHVSNIRAILESDKIKLVDTDKYFSAPPIFRNTTICVTGDFTCGNFQDVRGILGSYSATVVNSIVPGTRYLVVGDTQSHVDGRLISEARKAGIPVVSESTFFKRYEIDEDIRKNLL